MRELKATLAGLCTLIILITCIWIFSPKEYTATRPLWIFIYFIWVSCALFIWHHKKSPKRSIQWLELTAYSIAAAGLWFCFARLISHVTGSFDQGLSLFIDIGISLLITPGITFIALTGWVRSLFLKSRSDDDFK
ncbi:hypothetical protein [Diaphorobacter aerolatus]|uniref:Uncharacterized protein n=1 Tax=Diaphorobacter aerolatus TaxID=1288495 RepID=A0A7H0GLF7_9BURK|nr:hypothetical protein [Diaphorobacter aerolatus]QNP49123.1 hypothetical protein H9K75_02970 [Diaphorobacter aerolatus]